ncbi:MAG: hypothetical protein IJ371_01255 [Clostridia bacterium]|nr:hypothetical protein [Clostridia bacterium]
MIDTIVAIISVLGSALGSFCGIITSTKMTNYRLSQLEKKVDKHNNFASKIPLLEEKIKVCNHRIEDLEKNEK